MRLIDLHCNWARQYAAESSQHEGAFYPEVAARVGRVDGYLMGTYLAFLSCGRAAGDWKIQADPGASLATMIDRYEAEFPGRLVADLDDYDRWKADVDGLCWGVVGVAGFDRLVRSRADLDRLDSLFGRGVRVYQPIETADGVLGGSRDEGDARGLTDLGRAFLERLMELAPPAGKPGPRPILDLAHANAETVAEVLTWFEADATRPVRLPLLHSHGSIEAPGPEFPRRFRALGGMIGLSVGPPAVDSAATLRSTIEALALVPFLGQAGYEGIGVGSDYLELDATVDELAEIAKTAAWLSNSFSPGVAAMLGGQNARRLVEAAAGAVD